MSNKDQKPGIMQIEIVELAKSFNQIVERIRLLQSSLVESHEKVPLATEKLDKIVKQTEIVTHRMLDQIEEITSREQEIIDGLNSLKKTITSSNCDQAVTVIDNLKEKADNNCSAAYAIMDDLQFQDITSQQMNHAVSLLDEIEGKLHNVICALNGSEPLTVSSGDRKERVFDPQADFDESNTKQAEIDSLFENN